MRQHTGCRSRISASKAAGRPVLAGCGDQTVSAGILTCGSSANPGLLGICREPDRLQSGPRPLPMTGFRLPGGLHAYSGGTVREFHPIPYSLSRPKTVRKALKPLFTFTNDFITGLCQCQQKKQDPPWFFRGFRAEEARSGKPFPSTTFLLTFPLSFCIIRC